MHLNTPEFILTHQDELGDRLVAAGVPLVSFYGATETGMLLNSKRTFASDTAWNWVRAEGLIEQYLSLEPQGADTFEVVVKPGWPALIMSNRPDGSYATKDLVQRHPVHKSWYKVIGRLDDTLTQTLGEKTNPIPIELAIVSQKIIAPLSLLSLCPSCVAVVQRQ